MRKMLCYIFCISIFGIPLVSEATTTTTVTPPPTTSVKPENIINEATKSNPIPAPEKPVEEATPLTGTFDITTNYIFRGLSQSNNLPAFQGGLTYTFLKPGIYFNIWGSNVNLADKNGDTATLEIDTIVGVANQVGDNFTYDVSLGRYNYPKAAGLNYNELNAKVTYYFLVGLIGYSNNVYDSGKSGTYYNIGINWDIPSKYIFNLNDVTLSGGFGHYSLPRSAGLFSYDDYNIQISKTFGAYNLAIQWTDTSGANSYPLDGAHLIGTVTVSF